MEEKKENDKNMVLDVLNMNNDNNNDYSFQKLVKLQKLIKTESALRDICKNIRLL